MYDKAFLILWKTKLVLFSHIFFWSKTKVIIFWGWHAGTVVNIQKLSIMHNAWQRPFSVMFLFSFCLHGISWYQYFGFVLPFLTLDCIFFWLFLGMKKKTPKSDLKSTNKQKIHWSNPVALPRCHFDIGTNWGTDNEENCLPSKDMYICLCLRVCIC